MTIAVLESIQALQELTGAFTDTAAYVRRFHSDGPFKGGSLFVLNDPVPAAQPAANGITIFADSASPARRWRRDLGGGIVDAYMAGAYGDGAVSGGGVVLLAVTIDGSTLPTHDDSAAIQTLLDYLVDSETNVSSVTVSARVGDGMFRVDAALDGTQLRMAQGWSIDGSGATLLGRCKDKPVLDLTASRFGTLWYLQVYGTSDPAFMPECGIKIGRKENDEAANQMQMNRVGAHGCYRLAGLLNIASEQFTEIGCQFENEQSSAANLADGYGEAYGYCADTFNSAEGTRPRRSPAPRQASARRPRPWSIWPATGCPTATAS